MIWINNLTTIVCDEYTLTLAVCDYDRLIAFLMINGWREEKCQ